MPKERFNDVIKDNESLVLLLRNLKQFEKAFCENMVEGRDFTIRLEVRGCHGNVIHCRNYADATERPLKGKGEKLESKNSTCD